MKKTRPLSPLQEAVREYAMRKGHIEACRVRLNELCKQLNAPFSADSLAKILQGYNDKWAVAKGITLKEKTK